MSKTIAGGMGHGVGRSRERGAGRMKAIIAILLLLLLVYAGFKIVPAFVNDYELHDNMENTARYAVFSNQSDVQIKEMVWKKVQELGIPAQYDALKVTKGNRRVQISLVYTVEVPLLGYTLKLNFHPEVDNKAAF